MKNVTQKLEVPHVIYKPGEDNFKLLFETLIKEYELFRKEKENHICLICNYLMVACSAKYASENGISFVVSGLEKAQLGGTRQFSLKIDNTANIIAEKSARFILKNAYDKLKQTYNYKNNSSFQEFVDSTFIIPKNVTLLFPFIYLDYNIGAMKEVLAREIGWRPPVETKFEDYVSSGCKVMLKVLREIEKIGIIDLMEREQERRLIEEKVLEERFLENIKDLDISKPLDLRDKLFDELCIHKFIVEKCKEYGFSYIE